jgi:predicted methyltransferase
MDARSIALVNSGTAREDINGASREENSGAADPAIHTSRTRRVVRSPVEAAFMHQPLRKISFACAFAAIAAHLLPAAADSTGAEQVLDRAITASHRSDANKARDKYRHPKETLLFFGLRPDQNVVEMSPGSGWYTEILAPVLRDRGQYTAALWAMNDKTPEALRQVDVAFRAMLAGNPDLYAKARLTVMSREAIMLAPPASADLILTFRNVHNWAKAGTTDAVFRAFHEALKPGGVLGVVEHRARPQTSFEQQIETGYMAEAYVIETARKAGFKLVNKSEINANPKDTKDHPGGVWTLPPTLRYGDKDKEKYLAIGESDRMTLKFVKE